MAMTQLTSAGAVGETEIRMMKNKKMIAMMLTMSMLAAAFAGCLGGDEEDEIEEDRGVRGQPGTNYPSARNADDETNEYPAEPKYKIAKEQSEVEEIANYLLEAGVFVG